MISIVFSFIGSLLRMGAFFGMGQQLSFIFELVHRQYSHTNHIHPDQNMHTSYYQNQTQIPHAKIQNKTQFDKTTYFDDEAL